jgi:hypothetical protein
VTSPTAPDRDRQPRTTTADVVIHQALHGYNHGHRLLAASHDMADEDLRLVDRLSDASGPRPIPGNDGYLTGYPLPSGAGYALARTWYVTDAPRPNVVLTHTLLLPSAALNLARPSALAALLVPPTPDRDYSVSLTIPAGTDASRPLDDDAQLRSLLAGLYQPASTASISEVWFAEPTVEHRNDICLAVWDQQWPRLRGAFAFCAGAVESRQLTDRPFDLLGTPPGSRGLPALPDDTLRPDVIDALLADLRAPGALREFLRLVGPDSSRRRVMPLFVETFLLATGAAPDPADVLGHLTRRAPRPTSMRRLKRSVLGPRDGLLRSASPVAVLHAVLAAPVAQHVLADDAELDGWAAAAWLQAPDATLESLLTIPSDHAGDAADVDLGTVPALTKSGGTVAQVAPGLLEELIARQAGPAHLARLADARPALAGRLLQIHLDDSAWWEAWAALPEETFAELATADAVRRHLGPAVDALLSAPEGISRYRGVRDTAGAAAVAALLTRLAERRTPPPAWLPVLAEHRDFLAEILTSPRTSRQLTVALDAVPDTEFAKRTGWRIWQPLAERPAGWRSSPRRCAVLYIAATQHDGDLADRTLAISYGRLYHAFATGGSDDAWHLTAPMTSGKHPAWDRCRRLAHATARIIGDKHGRPRPAVVALLSDHDARAALIEELAEQQRPDRDSGGKSSAHPFETLLKKIRPW